MKVKWYSHAKTGRRNVTAYIHRHFGLRRAEKFMEQVDEKVSMIKQNPYTGIVDPLFEERPLEYRSVIINRLSKMVYRYDNDTIHIVAFWDTRQEPKRQANQVSKNHESKM
jgi:plasmid stabilization system protein ParE